MKLPIIDVALNFNIAIYNLYVHTYLWMLVPCYVVLEKGSTSPDASVPPYWPKSGAELSSDQLI